MDKSIRTLGYILLAVGAVLILGGHRLSALLQAMSLRNLPYHGAAVVVLTPGVSLTALGRRLVRKRRRRRRTHLSDFATRC